MSSPLRVQNVFATPERRSALRRRAQEDLRDVQEAVARDDVQRREAVPVHREQQLALVVRLRQPAQGSELPARVS